MTFATKKIRLEQKHVMFD